MRMALITGGLFLLSYVTVNRGLDPNPLELVESAIVVVGFAAGVNWLLRRGRSGPVRPGQQGRWTCDRSRLRSPGLLAE